MIKDLTQRARSAAGRRSLRFMTGGFVDKDMRPPLVLVSTALLAVVFANSALSGIYEALLSTPMTVAIGAFAIDKPLLLWINDGLMAVFFFLVGLEIKREIVEGQLSTWRTASLPALAAIGGMAAPALIYVAINFQSPETLRGWAIPAATDIAFALGVLALLGSRVPVQLKVFLLALAILDDLGAIIIIAMFYTADLSLISLAIGVAGAAVLLTINLAGVTRISVYIVIGIIIWAAVLKSGVHATLAGVMVALMVPLRTKEMRTPPLIQLEHSLKPWVAYAVMPAFAFANAGVSLEGLSLGNLLAPVPLGIALGLFLGKQIGVVGFSYVGVKLGLCTLPRGVTWAHIYGIALLAGIGFTMSLFIGTLAFTDAETTNAVRLGVLMGSLVSGTVGYLILRATLSPAAAAAIDERAADAPPTAERSPA